MITVAFLNQGFLMQREIISALRQTRDIRLIVVSIPDVPCAIEARQACDALLQQQCNILFTVNDWGLDAEGIIRNFTALHNMLHCNWCADDPFFHHIFHHKALSPIANRIDFISDRSYVQPLRNLGFKAHFCPLATDPAIFYPIPDAAIKRTACFVGNSYNRQIDGFTQGNESFIDGIIPFVTSLLLEYTNDHGIDLSARITDHIALSALPAQLSKEKAVFIVKHIVSYFYRKRLIISLCKQYPDFMIFGDEWWLMDCDLQRVSTAVGYYVNLSRTYQETKINIDVNRVVIREGLTQRVFDCLAANAFVITSKKTIVDELFETGGDKSEVVMFENERHLKELIDYYAIHDTQRQAIVDRGRARVLARHTYGNRIAEIFSTIGQDI